MIGVFDSGHGGLTILQTLVRKFPEQRFVYLGDHRNAPYGDRSYDEIHALTIAGIEHLFALGCRLVILACNTAAATSLRRIQQGWLARTYPDRRVLGVLVPMVEAVTGVPWIADFAVGHQRRGTARTVAIFATRRTVDSLAYPQEIAKRAPEVTVVQQPCRWLARLIEDGAKRPALHLAVRRYVGSLLRRLGGVPPEAALLGCTHYPLIQDLFAEMLPPSVEILSQPDLTALSLQDYLQRHPDLAGSAEAGQAGVPLLLTTGDAALVSGRAGALFRQPMTFQHVAVLPVQTV